MITKEDLKPDEVICDKCNGKGYIKKWFLNDMWRYTCQKCKGIGKLDWIENICGVKEPTIKPPHVSMKEEMIEMFGKDSV